MAKNSITDYSKTAASNTDIQSVDIDEGCLPSGINNAIRELMADLADMNDGTVSLTSPSFAAASLTGNLSFGDNDKAIFGAGTDLEIYHDGTNSYISELTPTGSLFIDGSNIFLRSSGGEEFLKAVANAQVELYYNDAIKLTTTSTGVDVTGTVTADGLTVDGVVDVTSTTSLSTNLQNTGGSALLPTYSFNGSADVGMFAPSTNNLAFATFQVERMRIDSSGNVGIGITNPTEKFTVVNSSSGIVGRFTNNTNQTLDLGVISGSGSAGGVSLNNANSGYLSFQSGGSERMRIDSSGNVGIGTSSPSNKLDIKGTVGFEATNSTNRWLAYTYTDNTLRLNYNGAGADEVTITSGGNVGIGTSSPSAPLDSVSNTNGVSLRVRARSSDEFGLIEFVENNGSTAHGYIGTPLADTLAFYTNGLNERMRIDSSGDVLMGNTVPNPASGFNDQSGFGYDKSAGKVEIASTSGLALSLGRNLSSDGHLAEFRKQSNSVGDIQTHSGKLQIGQGNANLQFSNASDAIIPSNGSGTLNDDALDIGLSNARFDDIYATNGTIQTSDRNEKQDIEALSEAEQRVAVAAKGLLRKFRWIDSVEEKGDDARIHFGIIAQDLQAAFEAEGLDAGRYAMFINSTWTDEETGEERSRMGVRYNQLLAFIIAAI